MSATNFGNMSRAGSRSTDALFADGSEAARLLSTIDWSKHSMGPSENWPQSLRTSLSLCLASRYPICIIWGTERIYLYNDAYTPIVGDKHPDALGNSYPKVWPEIWDSDIRPILEEVETTGKASWQDNILLVLRRFGFNEECYFLFSFAPIRDESNNVGGVFIPIIETTSQVVGDRRLQTLRDLAARSVHAKTLDEAFSVASEVLVENIFDIPFALFYHLDLNGESAQLVKSSGIDGNSPYAPESVSMSDSTKDVWQLQKVRETGEHHVVRMKNAALPGGPWPEAAQGAMVLPITRSGVSEPVGFLVAGISPRRPLDSDYQSFLTLIANQIGNTVSNAIAYQEEKKRAEALAAIDRAKTVFFSNVSHEFRTPLTLMLGPLEEMMSRVAQLTPDDLELLKVSHRNGQRLLKLVNSLLDFSRIEANRIQAVFEPVKLSSYTAELSSSFRSAMEKAGLKFTVDCPALPEPVYVDRDMWEKIVLNLISNAFKYTLKGEIQVLQNVADGHVLLTVKDTGIGIPQEEINKIFDRFYRVEGAGGRTQEGTGIGLALVHELVKLHGGSVDVQSNVGSGSTFTVKIPLGKSHLPAERISAADKTASTATGAMPYVQEALRWIPGALEQETIQETDAAALTHSSGTVLIADDNADMREYIHRLLSSQYSVHEAPEGEEALKIALRVQPDLVVADVMMPKLDGFGLLKNLRENAVTSSIPVIILSARAGEESRLEGLQAGADDYLIKPFSARELLARVSGTIALHKTRREALQRETQLKAETNHILQSMTDGFISLDTNYRFAYINHAAEKLIGLNISEVAGKTHWEVFPATLNTPIENAYRTAMEKRTVVKLENYYEPWQRWFEVNAYPSDDGGISIYFRDITERKNTEITMRKSEQMYRAIGESIDYGVWVCDPDGRNIYASESFLKLVGLTQEECSNYGWGSVLHPDDVEQTMQAWKECVASGKQWDREHSFRGVDGMWHPVLARGVPIRNEKGEITAWVGINLDISKLKQVENELRLADQRKNEFLATLAHELRNPLAPIRNGLQIMQIAQDDAAEVQRAREVMERQVHHMVRLIDDLMDLSRINRGKIELRKQRIEISSILQNSLETSRPLLDHAQHVIVLRLTPQPVYVDADVVRMSQVFANLINNAAKYTPNKGQITIIVEAAGEEAIVRVKDNGIGIPLDMLNNVFDMFVQINRTDARLPSGGLGIGLNIVKRLVEMHGGEVTAHSEGVGLGSEFVVRLPLLQKLAETEPSKSAPKIDSKSKGGRRILVADDHEDSMASLATMLSILGNDVRTSPDGLSAVQTAEDFRPEIVFLDIGMPNMDGYDACREIRKKSWASNTVIVALTGWGQDEDKNKSRNAGFNHHLVKPIEFEWIEKIIKG